MLKASTPLSRRTFLQAGGLPGGGLALPQLLAARAEAKSAGQGRTAPPAQAGGSAKACILLYMLGGPPQQETFDIKPDAPGTARSLFRPIATNVPGIDICELLPDVARQADRLAIVRSVHHGGYAPFYGARGDTNTTCLGTKPRACRRSPRFGRGMEGLRAR